MLSPRVSAVLFVNELQRLATFYRETLGLELETSDDDHVILRTAGFALVVHRIPEHFARSIMIEQPPRRRESAAIKLSFPVESIANVRARAAALGGGLDPPDSEWSDERSITCKAYDPEGNVFQVSQRIGSSV